jgi:hypothetical protein
MRLAAAIRLNNAITEACRILEKSPEHVERELELSMARVALQRDIDDLTRGQVVAIVDTEATTLRPIAGAAE